MQHPAHTISTATPIISKQAIQAVHACSVTRVNDGAFVQTVNPSQSILVTGFNSESSVVSALRAATQLHIETGVTVLALAEFRDEEEEFGLIVQCRSMNTETRSKVTEFKDVLFSHNSEILYVL